MVIEWNQAACVNYKCYLCVLIGRLLWALLTANLLQLATAHLAQMITSNRFQLQAKLEAFE